MGSKTKDRIIQAAIDLFNEYGTGAVSTNRIASEIGISPGNLYYHYQNKEDIIRAILQVMIADWDRVWLSSKEDYMPSLGDLEDIIRLNLQLQLKYRFFYRELIPLMRADPELKVVHQQIQTQRIGELQQFFQVFVDAGVFQIPESVDMESLLTSCWIISNYWLSYLESGGVGADESQIEQGIALILSVLHPFMPAMNDATKT